MGCVESVFAADRAFCAVLAVLGVWDGGPGLGWRWRDFVSPLFGSASAGSMDV